MYKIAIIGDKDTVIPFKVLGIDIFPVELNNNTSIEVKKIIDNLSLKKYGIIFIIEDYANDKVLNHYKKQIVPMITIVPNNRSSLNLGLKQINENMEKAIGTNIF